MIPPSHLYPWIDSTPSRRGRRRRATAGLLPSIVAGGLSGAVAAVLAVMVVLA